MFFKMVAGGHFGFGPLMEFAHTFTTGTQAIFFNLSFMDDKSIEKTISTLNGHGIGILISTRVSAHCQAILLQDGLTMSWNSSGN